jgi:hypothetical protein
VIFVNFRKAHFFCMLGILFRIYMIYLVLKKSSTWMIYFFPYDTTKNKSDYRSIKFSLLNQIISMCRTAASMRTDFSWFIIFNYVYFSCSGTFFSKSLIVVGFMVLSTLTLRSSEAIQRSDFLINY